MPEKDAVRFILMGTILMVLALVPGAYQRLVEGLRDGLNDFHSQRFRVMPLNALRTNDTVRRNVQGPTWLAALGFGFILLGLLALM